MVQLVQARAYNGGCGGHSIIHYRPPGLCHLLLLLVKERHSWPEVYFLDILCNKTYGKNMRITPQNKNKSDAFFQFSPPSPPKIEHLKRSPPTPWIIVVSGHQEELNSLFSLHPLLKKRFFCNNLVTRQEKGRRGPLSSSSHSERSDTLDKKC